MAIEKMMLVRASGNMDSLNDLIIRLFSFNNFHAEEAVRYLSSTMGYVSLNETSPFDYILREIEDTAGISGKELPRGKLLEASESGKDIPEDYSKKLYEYTAISDKYLADMNGILTAIKNEIIDRSGKRKEYADEIDVLKAKQEKLSHFMKLDVDVDELLNASYLTVRFGSLPKDTYRQLKALEEEGKFLFTPCSSDSYRYWGVYCTPKKYRKEVDKIFATLYFEPLDIDPDDGTVSEIFKATNDRINELNALIEEENELIAKSWDENSGLITSTYSILCDLEEIYKFRKYAATDGESFYYTGWIPKTAEAEAKDILGKLDGIEVTIKQYDGKSDKNPPPTKLKNNLLFRPYEYYVEMYGVPEYGSTDITSFVALTYTVIFGIMFGDLGQGFVLMITGILMWKLKNMALGKILIPCGISSMCFGLVFGSFFGYEHLLDPLYHAVGMEGKPLEVMDSINTVLIAAIVIGIALVIVAMLVNTVVNLKAGKFGAALFENNGITGIIMYVCLVSLIVKMMAGMEIIPSKLCGILIGITAVILFMKEILIGIVDRHDNRKPESIADFIMQNIFELIEYVLSYFSNTVSFLRVGAFVLVHAGMMSVVFSLAGDSGNIVVVILGNILVIALEGLLTGIQALRLEFYEMFSRCFEGNGKPFMSIADKIANK